MTVENDRDLEGLKAIGYVCALTLKEMAKAVEPGINTKELDLIGERIFKEYGAYSAPITMYDFPGTTCISLNNEAAHGIPSEDRIVKEGDMINIDVSGVMDGYYSDTAATYMVGEVEPVKRQLIETAQSALHKALNVARAGRPLNSIGRTVETTARRAGFTVIMNLPGHGIGHELHEPPQVLNFFHPKFDERLHEGLVMTIEPFISNGAQSVDELDDGWTLVTPDGSYCAQFEHTIVVTKKRPIILTQAA